MSGWAARRFAMDEKGKIDKIDRVNLAQKLSLFDEHWSPHIVGELNDQHVKLAKIATSTRSAPCGSPAGSSVTRVIRLTNAKTGRNLST